MSLTTDQEAALSCTCPDYKYWHSGTVGGQCKHMAAVETDASVVHDEPAERVNGPYRDYDCYGNFDHTFWRCENCSAEAAHKSALDECW